MNIQLDKTGEEEEGNSSKNELYYGHMEGIESLIWTILFRVPLLNEKYYNKLAALHSSEKKRFMLDETFQQNAFKFAVYDNPKLLFPFFISCNLIFSLMNALVYVDIDQGIH